MLERRGLVEIDAGIFRAPDFEDQPFLDFEAAIAGEGFRLRHRCLGRLDGLRRAASA